MNAEMEAGRVVATPFVPRDPAGIPPRAWLYGRHLIRRNVSVTVAPGGVGKSSLTIIQALELVTGRQFLGDWNAGPLRVWLFNLEDERSELDRRIAAAMKHYAIEPQDIGGRLFVDTGREQQLILANQIRDEVQIDKRLIENLKLQLTVNNIDVLIVDPFVSSHQTFSRSFSDERGVSSDRAYRTIGALSFGRFDCLDWQANDRDGPMSDIKLPYSVPAPAETKSTSSNLTSGERAVHNAFANAEVIPARDRKSGLTAENDVPATIGQVGS